MPPHGSGVGSTLPAVYRPDLLLPPAALALLRALHPRQTAQHFTLTGRCSVDGQAFDAAALTVLTDAGLIFMIGVNDTSNFYQLTAQGQDMQRGRP